MKKQLFLLFTGFAILSVCLSNKNNLKVQGKGTNEYQLKNLETPVYVHRNENNVENPSNIQSQDGVLMLAQIKEDISKLTSKLRNVKSNKNKIKILTKGKAQLEKESQNLSEGIQKDVAELLNSKEVGLSMNNILAKYEVKLKKSKLSKLKLSDVITLKNKIKKKLLREIQGLRTSSSNFKEIKNLNPDDLKRIIKAIKKKLNY